MFLLFFLLFSCSTWIPSPSILPLPVALSRQWFFPSEEGKGVFCVMKVCVAVFVMKTFFIKEKGESSCRRVSNFGFSFFFEMNDDDLYFSGTSFLSSPVGGLGRMLWM